MKKTVKFSELGLAPELFSAIEDMGFEYTTEIQSKAIPLMRDGYDIIGKSQTGTGKTIAFAVPAIEKTDTYREPCVQTVILCPTRELVQQAADEFKKLTAYINGIHIAEIYGGTGMEKQFSSLKKANIVIGTPGRVMDHMRRHTLKLNNVNLVVLDEADEMLSMGFIEDIETILSATDESRQTVLFSATMPKEILDLTDKFQKDPILIEINKKQITLDSIKQQFVNVPSGAKTDALCLLLRYHSPQRAMIFCNTKQTVDEVSLTLEKYGFDVQGLHGDMLQSQRTKVMQSFKAGKTNILVATDVAARGIDVDNLDYVFNYDIPNNNEYYVHRIGRTGRAGKSGIAITLCQGRRQIINLLSIARYSKSEVEETEIPTVAEIKEKILRDTVNSVKENIITDSICKYENIASELLDSGYRPQNIISALIDMTVSDNTLNLKDIHAERKTGKSFRTNFEGEEYSKIKLNIGRNQRIAPNFLVAAICDYTGLSGKDIGKIEIYDDYTTVGVPDCAREQIVEDLQERKICGKTVKTEKYDVTNKDPSFSDNHSQKSRKRRSDDSFRKSFGTPRSKSSYKKAKDFLPTEKDTAKSRKSTHGKYSKNKTNRN